MSLWDHGLNNPNDKNKTKPKHETTMSELIITDTFLPINEHFELNSIHIKDSTLSLQDQGILDLHSKHDILIENGEINMKGKTNANRTYGRKDKPTKNKLYGDKINQIYIGKQGHRGDSCSGGLGGSGLRLICNKLILNNSIINVSGSHCCNGGRWWCGAGHGGSCLIICDELIMDNKSKILARNGYDFNDDKEWNNSYQGRIVIQTRNFLSKEKKNYLIYGYLRINYNDRIIDDICDLCISFFSANNMYENYKMSPKPIFVDDEWKEIDGIGTTNKWITNRQQAKSRWWGI